MADAQRLKSQISAHQLRKLADISLAAREAHQLWCHSRDSLFDGKTGAE